MTENYRSSTSLTEIEKILKESKKKQKHILWQSYPDYRSIFEVQKINPNLKDREITVELDLESQELDVTKEIYLKIDVNDAIFKGKIVKLFDDKKTITMSIPQEIKLSELRDYPRFLLSLDKPTNIKMIIVDDGSEIVFESIVENISINGIGLLIPIDYKKQIFTDGALSLIKISNYEFSSPIRGKIVFSKATKLEVSGQTEKYIKCGVILIDSFDETFFKNFTDGLESI